MVDTNKIPIVILFGLVCLAGAAALAWLSSPATLQLTRQGPVPVIVHLESRLFGMIPVASAHSNGVQGARLVRTRTGRSHTPDHLEFDTAHGVVNHGRTQQLFAIDFPEIEGFFADGSLESAQLSSIARGRELWRFIVAQFFVLCLGLGGLGLEWLAIRSLMGRNRDIEIRPTTR